MPHYPNPATYLYCTTTIHIPIHNIHSQQVPIKTNNDGKVVFFANAAVTHRKKTTNIEQGKIYHERTRRRRFIMPYNIELHIIHKCWVLIEHCCWVHRSTDVLLAARVIIRFYYIHFYIHSAIDICTTWACIAQSNIQSTLYIHRNRCDKPFVWIHYDWGYYAG